MHQGDNLAALLANQYDYIHCPIYLGCCNVVLTKDCCSFLADPIGATAAPSLQIDVSVRQYEFHHRWPYPSLLGSPQRVYGEDVLCVVHGEPSFSQPTPPRLSLSGRQSFKSCRKAVRKIGLNFANFWQNLIELFSVNPFEIQQKHQRDGEQLSVVTGLSSSGCARRAEKGDIDRGISTATLTEPRAPLDRCASGDCRTHAGS
jgi:hypothetical protein